MTTRRTFIRIAASAAVPASVSLRAAASAGTSKPRREPEAVIVDADHAAARSFGDRFSAQGSAVLSIHEGDVTASWLGHIRPMWSQRRATIAGLTTPAALFCLEQLAWPHGLRVVFHAEHILLADGSLSHQVQRDPQMARLTASNLQRAGTRWPVRLAEAMAMRGATSSRRPGPSMAALHPQLPAGATLLTSWIIAAA
jgi:hypothetical protein